MVKYQKLKTPKGLKEVSHFFLQDKGRDDTRIEFMFFEITEKDGVVELPNGTNTAKGDIVMAEAHVETNFDIVKWSTRPDNFWRWFNRVLIAEKDRYEIVKICYGRYR